MPQPFDPSVLLRRYKKVSDQLDDRELAVILRELAGVLAAGAAGDVVEFGCYVGTAALYMRRVMLAYGPAAGRQLHVYDSFAGLPGKSPPDNSPSGLQFRPGELRAGKTELIRHFRQANLPLPVIHKAWFKDLTARDVPAKIAFAFLDGDYYESVRDSLRLVTPALSKGAVIVIDDYQNEALPGAATAADEWLESERLKGRAYRLRAEASLAIIS